MRLSVVTLNEALFSGVEEAKVPLVLFTVRSTVAEAWLVVILRLVVLGVAVASAEEEEKEMGKMEVTLKNNKAIVDAIVI